MVSIDFENLGNISKGTIDLKNLTIFCGPNNTGKTYIAYALYSLLDKDFEYKLNEIRPIIEELYKEGSYEIDLKVFFDKNYKKMKEEVENGFSNSLGTIFSANDEEFLKSKIKINLNEENIRTKLFTEPYVSSLSIGKKEKIVFEVEKAESSSILKLVLLDNTIPKNAILDNLKAILSRFIFNDLFSNSFLLPAERTGLNLFYRELSSERTAMFHHFGQSEIDKMALIKDLIVSKYPQAIADYIDFLNRAHNLKKMDSEYKDLSGVIQKEIIKGKYKVDKDGIYFLPYKKDSNKDNYNQKISLHLASSTVKTFFSLVFYLEHLAKKGDTLIIDEPELNLHPDNQRKMARILSIISNRNIKVIVSTHSDYFIRELNNLIMLNDNFKSKKDLMKKYHYLDEMVLSLDNVNAYMLNKNEISLMEKDKKEGIIATTFDEVICNMNSISDEIYYRKEEELENE